MAGKVYRNLAEWLIVGLIVFSLIVERVLHMLEKWAENHFKVQTVLKNLYRELMILGMISFGFILYVFIAEPKDDIKMTFEVAHVFIFLFAIFHSIVVCCAILMSLGMSRHWKKMERIDVDTYVDTKKQFLGLKRLLHERNDVIWRYFLWWEPNLALPFRLWRLHEVMTFHDIRFQFIHFYKLPYEFRYSQFLRTAKSAVFVELVEIHWTHFFFFLIFVFLDIARSPLRWPLNFEAYFLIGNSIFNMIAVVLLEAKMHRVYWRMTRNPAVHYHADDSSDQRSSPNEIVKLNDQGQRIAPMALGSERQPPNIENTEERNLTQKVENKIAVSPIAPDLTINDILWRRQRRTRDNLRTSEELIKAVPRQSQEYQSQGDSSERRKAISQDIPHRLEEYGSHLRKMASADALGSSHENRRRNMRMAEYVEEAQDAEQTDETKKYHRWVIYFLPRLSRRASITEKLFWFGSRHFFSWCVEWVLFFTSVNLSATITKIAFFVKEQSTYGKKVPTYSRLAVNDIFIQPEKTNKEIESLRLLLIALIVGAIALVLVLTRTAGIMKRLIIVLSNGGLLGEERTKEVIERVKLDSEQYSIPSNTTQQALNRQVADCGEDAGAEMRKRVSIFVRETTDEDKLKSAVLPV